MASTYKVLGQLVPPTPNTEADVYTVPSGTQTVVSTIIVANLETTSGVFRIAVRPNGETLANQHYIAFDVPLIGTDSTTLTLGLTLDAGDVITVRTDLDNVAFNVFGSEIT